MFKLSQRSRTLLTLRLKREYSINITVTEPKASVEVKTSKRTIPIDFKSLKFESKVPATPYIAGTFTSHRTEIDQDTIKLLERLSLVNVDSKYVNAIAKFSYDNTFTIQKQRSLAYSGGLHRICQ